MTNQEIAVEIVNLSWNKQLVSEKVKSSDVSFKKTEDIITVNYAMGRSWWSFSYEPKIDKIDAGFYWGLAPRGSQPQSQFIFNITKAIKLFRSMK